MTSVKSRFSIFPRSIQTSDPPSRSLAMETVQAWVGPDQKVGSRFGSAWRQGGLAAVLNHGCANDVSRSWSPVSAG